MLDILTGAKNWKNMESEMRKSEIKNRVLPNLQAALGFIKLSNVTCTFSYKILLARKNSKGFK